MVGGDWAIRPIEGLGHVPSSGSSLRVLCPNGHLGFAPIKTGSFRVGLDCAPDLICAVSGSCDVGPGPLGADVSSSRCTTRITGPKYIPPVELRAKLEGAGKLGERFIGMVGVRDPYTIENIDAVITWARQQAAERFGPAACELHYTVYGRDAILGALEPLRRSPGHEVCVVVQAIAPTREMAEEVCMTGTRQMFYARLPAVKGTAGGVAFLLDEVMRGARPTAGGSTARCLDDPLELFPTFITEAGV